ERSRRTCASRPRNSRFSCRSFSPLWSGAGSFFATRAFGICSLGGNRNDFERPTEHTGSPGRGPPHDFTQTTNIINQLTESSMQLVPYLLFNEPSAGKR